MDTITHIALGACVGELFFERRIGKKSLLIGAIANSVPDIDFVAAFWMSNAQYLLVHRGFSHSFLFMILVAPLLAFIAHKFIREIKFTRWLLFFAIEIFLHLFIDTFNAYGTGLLEPFTSERFSFQTLFVADPFFSIWIVIAFIALVILKKDNKTRKKWARFGLITCSLYFLYCINNKIKVDKDVKQILKKQQIAYKNFLTTPTPFNNWLWYIAVKKEEGYDIGYRSVFDSKDTMTFTYFARNDELLKDIRGHKDLQYLLKFSQDYYVIQQRKDSLIFNDLRFEQIAGWQNPCADFVLHYYLKHPEENDLIVQRGRFVNWNKETISSFIKRIKGN